MKVLLCSTTDIGGGAAKAAYRLLIGLVDAGIEANMLVLYKKSSDPNVICISDLNKNRRIFSRIFNAVLYKIQNQIRKIRWARYPNRSDVLLSDLEISNLKKTLRKVQFDILHLHWVQEDFIDFKDLKSIKKPMVMTMHDCYAFTGICHYYECSQEYYQTECKKCPLLNSTKNYDFSTRVFRQKERRYNDIDISFISPSNWLAKKAKESKILANRSVSVIPNGISIKVFKPIDKKIARKALDISLNKKYILFGAVSALSDHRKGYKFLEKVILNVHKEKNDEIEFMIFGEKHNNEISISNNKLLNLGFIHNEKLLTLVYSAADVMIVPSKQENLPNTIMESLSCGTPVVAFDIGGNGDMINHKRNGYLATPYKKEDLVKGIIWCIENNIDGKLSKNARNKVMTEFNLQKITKQHKSFYENLIS